MRSERPRQIGHVAGTVVVVAALIAPHGHSLAAAPQSVVPTSVLSHITTMAIADGDWPAYVATASGLYRAVSRSYTLWQKQNDLGDIIALAPNASNPDDLLYTRSGLGLAGTGVGVYRSLDSGRTSRLTSSCLYATLTRSSARPIAIYGATLVGELGKCPKASAVAYNPDYLDRSSDDGLSWTQVYTSGNGYDFSGGIGPIGVSPQNPGDILAAVSWDRGNGALVGSDDGGTTWTQRYHIPLDEMFPNAVTFDPHNARFAWAAFGAGGLWRSTDAGHTWHMAPLDGLETKLQYGTTVDISATVLAQAEVDALSADPLSGRLYARVVLIDPFGPTSRGTIFAICPQGHVDRFARTAERTIPYGNERFPSFTLTRSGQMMTWCGPQRASAPPLSIRPLIGPGNWEVSDVFSAATAAWARRTLGQPLSPTTLYHGQSAQYFDKGAIATDGRGGFSAVPLVPPLLAAHPNRPVGGGASTVAYQTLSSLHARRTPSPVGFHGGILAVPGGTFVPYSSALAVASGYVVPPYFWRYLTDPRTAPDGWLHDIGLPLTPAVPATVTKGKMGVRHIMVQAFEDAVLTYDPHNPAPFQVERANIGVDYAVAFPQAVR